MKILLLLQIIVFFGYLFVIQRKFGWTRSISISYYKLGSVADNIIFIGWTVTMGFLTALFGYVSDVIPIWFFISGFCISFVGVTAPYAINKYVKFLHYTFAIGCIISPLIGMVTIGNYFPIFSAFLSTILISFSLKMNNRFYWIEVFSYISILIGMINIII